MYGCAYTKKHKKLPRTPMKVANSVHGAMIVSLGCDPGDWECAVNTNVYTYFPGSDAEDEETFRRLVGEHVEQDGLCSEYPRRPPEEIWVRDDPSIGYHFDLVMGSGRINGGVASVSEPASGAR